MWNKITLRMKITLLTALALSVVATGVTGLSIYNARQITFLPRGNLTITQITHAAPFPVRERTNVRIFMPPHVQSDETSVVLSDGPSVVLFDYGFMHFDSHMQFIPSEVLQMQEVSGWHIRGQDALTELSQTRQDFQTHSIVIAALAVLFGTFAAYIISGQVLKPITVLAGRIEDVDANNLNQALDPPKTIDEVSRLTHSFNNMLEKLNRSFEAQKLFAQNAAHELKTPLASMRANIEVLELDAQPTADEYKEVVGVVKDNTERLIGLVEGLLSLTGTSDDAAWQSFGGRELFDEILDELRDDIAEKGLEVSITDDCRLKGDRALLMRACSNLVHNAVRYNVDGGRVEINLLADSITIADSGVGIPAEHLAHIFEPFYCVDQSRSKHLGGHGLGMAIAKNIFDKHHMKLQISSEPGVGTTVTVSQ